MWWFQMLRQPFFILQFLSSFWLTPIRRKTQTFLQIPQKLSSWTLCNACFFFNRSEKNQFLLLSEICFASRLSSSIFRSRIQTKWKAKQKFIVTWLIFSLLPTRALFIPLLSVTMIYALNFAPPMKFFPGSHCDMCT